MKSFNTKINIDYSWWRSDGSEVKQEHLDPLEESAESRIFKKMNEGFVSGELNENINMTDDDPEDGVEYRGSNKLMGNMVCTLIRCLGIVYLIFLATILKTVYIKSFIMAQWRGWLN